MKTIIYSLFVLLLWSCGSTTVTQQEDDKWEVVVFDPGYNTYLTTIARPKEFYSKSYYKNRNRILVQIWNQRVLEPTRFDPAIYELAIQYDNAVNYDLDFEFKLYNFFEYMKYLHKIDFGVSAPK